MEEFGLRLGLVEIENLVFPGFTGIIIKRVV